MATAKKSAPKASLQAPKYPANLGLEGVLSFPLWNDHDINTSLPEWRAKKGLKKGKFPDRIGATLLLNQAQVDKAQKYLLDVFLPYITELHEFNSDKGHSPEDVDTLRALIEAEDWSHEDGVILPLRHLTEKDEENIDDESIVAKFSFGGSGGNEIARNKVLARDEDGTLIVMDLDSYTDNGVKLPALDTLFWGSRNTFRGSFNLNAYSNASTGIGAYTRRLYLRTDLPMFFGGGSDDETVLESDFE